MEAAQQSGFRGSSRFRVVDRIGRGASGEVFEAIDLESNARVAVKALRDPSPESLRLLKHEFRAVQDIRHPNLVSLGELLEEQGQVFFTMELVEGKDFLQYVSNGYAPEAAPPTTMVKTRKVRDDVRASRPSIPDGVLPFDETRLRGALAQLVAAVRALHAAHKVHRDIKPTNVLVDRDGRVVVLDFGIVADARVANGDDGELIGTPVYMAPEQATSGDVGPAADWYAVGVVLYHALTGQPPFSGAMTTILTAKVTELPPRPRDRVPGVPADLDALCMDLLAIEPGDRPTGAEIARRVGLVEEDASAESNEVFVGRKAELDALLDAFEATRRGASVVVFVQGESGVGKTVLARHFTEWLSASVPDLLLLRGRCYERESVPYKGVDEAIDALSGFLRRAGENALDALAPEDLAALYRSFPVLKGVQADGVRALDEVVSPRQQRARLFEATRALMRRLASRHSLVLAIDDLHWADADALALLTEMMRAPFEPPMMLLCTLRSEAELRERVQDLTREIASGARDVRIVEVGKLPSADAEQLARTLLQARSSAPPSPESIRALLAETQGHPLFIDELVRQHRAGEGESAGVHLNDVLWRRIGALDATARRFLDMVAVAGMPVGMDIVAAAADVDRAQLPAVVGALQYAHLLRTTGQRNETWVSAYHDRVQQTVLGHLGAEQMAEAHERLARAGEASGRCDPEFLYTHWEGAHQGSRAAEYARLAGDRAAEALAFERAVHLYGQALALGAEDAPARRALQTKLAEALTAAGREAEAAEVRLALARESSGTEALDLRRQAAEQLLVSGHFERGKALLRDVLTQVRERFPTSALAVIFWLLVVRISLRLRGIRLDARGGEAPSKEAIVRIDAIWSAGAGFAMTDNVRGAYFQTKNLLLAMKVGDLRRTARALAMEVCFRSTSGTKGAARNLALLDEAKRLAERVGTPDALAMGDTAEGYARYFLGEWRSSIDAFVRAETVFRDRCVGVHWQINSARTMLYRALAFSGGIEELRRRYPPVLRDAQERGDKFTAVNLQCGAAFLVALADDRPDAAEALLGEAKQALPPFSFLVQHYYHLLSEVQLDLYRGRARDARARLSAAMRTIRRSLLARVQSFAAQTEDAIARSALACAEEAGSDLDECLAEAAQAADALAKIPVPWAPALGRLHRAGVAAARGDRDTAVATLREAITLLDRAGLLIFATAARRRLAALVGGDEAATLLARVTEVETAQGIARGAKLAAVHAPGFARLDATSPKGR